MVDVEALHILGLVLVGAVAVTSGWPLGKLLGHKVSWTALLPDTRIHRILYSSIARYRNTLFTIPDTGNSSGADKFYMFTLSTSQVTQV